MRTFLCANCRLTISGDCVPNHWVVVRQGPDLLGLFCDEPCLLEKLYERVRDDEEAAWAA